MSKLKLWNETAWEEAERNWETGAQEAAKLKPIKKLLQMPVMAGITPETAKHLKWKSLKWMVGKDSGVKVLKGFLRHPVKYGLALLRSMLKVKPYIRDGD